MASGTMRTLFTFLTVFLKSKNMTFYVFSNAVARKCRPSSKDQADHIDATTTSRGDTTLHFEMSCGIWYIVVVSLWCASSLDEGWQTCGPP